MSTFWKGSTFWKLIVVFLLVVSFRLVLESGGFLEDSQLARVVGAPTSSFAHLSASPSIPESTHLSVSPSVPESTIPEEDIEDCDLGQAESFRERYPYR
jgi:hypothetical protein